MSMVSMSMVSMINDDVAIGLPEGTPR